MRTWGDLFPLEPSEARASECREKAAIYKPGREPLQKLETLRKTNVCGVLLSQPKLTKAKADASSVLLL